MFISNHAVSAVSRLYAGSQATGTRRVDAAGSVQQPDALELSGEAQSFGDILQKLQSMDDVRAEQVNAVAARQHVPASADIAAKMLAMRY